MVDVDPEKPDKLRFVLSHSPTLASATLLQVKFSYWPAFHCLREDAYDTLMFFFVSAFIRLLGNNSC